MMELQPRPDAGGILRKLIYGKGFQQADIPVALVEEHFMRIIRSHKQ